MVIQVLRGRLPLSCNVEQGWLEKLLQEVVYCKVPYSTIQYMYWGAARLEKAWLVPDCASGAIVDRLCAGWYPVHAASPQRGAVHGCVPVTTSCGNGVLPPAVTL